MAKFSLTAIVLATMYASIMAQSAAAAGGSTTVAGSVCGKNLKVVTQGDLDAIKQCTIFKGTISVEATSATELKLQGVEQLIGDLIMSNNADMTSFSASDLQKVDGQVKIINHTILNKAEFPKLTEVKELSFVVLPALKVIDFSSGLTKVNTMRIEDTRAPKVDGFKAETIGLLTLLSNKYMDSFDSSTVKYITGELLVFGNKQSLIFNASNLANINSATFLNVAEVQMPALSQVNSDISFLENEFMSLNLDELKTIGGTLTIANNNRLTKTSFKNLNTVIGAFSIGNNSQLNDIEGFPVLSEIHGTVDLAGAIDKFDIPALRDIRGGMSLQTTSNKLGCSEIEHKLKGENIVKGNTWSCSASMQESNMVPTVGQNPSIPKSGSNSGGSGTSGSSGNGSDSRNMASSASKLVISSSSLFAFATGFIYYFYL